MQRKPNSESVSKLSPASLAQKALMMIAQAKLPPTPNVYSVFYNHFANTNEHLSEDLSRRSDDPKSISLEHVESLHAQFLSSSTVGQEEHLGDSLGEELARFRAIVADQKEAGESYSKCLDTASKLFVKAEPNEVVQAVDSLSADTKAMQSQMHEMSLRVLDAETKVNHLQAELRQAQSLMLTDHLTGLGNRRSYESMLRTCVRSLGDAKLSGHPYLALIDCDKFKKINDTYGHPFGDEVIQLLAATLREASPSASVARLGGDEFALFARFPSIAAVEQFADELRMKVGERKIINKETRETLVQITLSVGIARIHESDSEESWHERADRLLYEAKNLGGDRIVIEKVASR